MAPVIALAARRHDHVRPRPDHAGARELARDGDSPLGAGQHRQLRPRCASGTRSASAASSSRASSRWTRWSRSARTARTASSKSSCTVRCASPTRAAACCRATSTTATPTRAPAPTPAAGTTRPTPRVVDASGDVLSPAQAAGHSCGQAQTLPNEARDSIVYLLEESQRPGELHAHRGRRARHLRHELQGPARHRARPAPGGDRRRFAQDRGPHQEPVLRGAHGAELPPGDRRRRGRPRSGPGLDRPARRPGQPRLHLGLLPAPHAAGDAELPARLLRIGAQPVCGRRGGL